MGTISIPPHLSPFHGSDQSLQISLTLSNPFLGAFSKLRTATISFIMPVGQSVRMEQLGSHWTDFH
jgi:hypothetical protein